MSLSPHSTPVLVDKSIDEQNMRRQNRSDNVKVLESRKDIVGKSEKKKSKRVIMDVDQVCICLFLIRVMYWQPWKLYIPVGESFPVTHWSSYTNVDIVSVLQSKLTDVQLQMFRESCFGYFLDLPRVAIHAQLIRSLMFRELVQDKCDQFYVKLNDEYVLRFCLREFGIVSGLNYCGNEHVEGKFSGPKRLVDTYFFGFEVVSKKSLIDCFEKKKWQSDEDAVKIAIIYFINTFLMSTQAQKTFISKRDFHLVESGEYVSFPWSKIAFRALMKSVRDMLRGKPEFYRIGGFPLALQVWFYECCTVVDQKFAIRVGDHAPCILNREMTDMPTSEDFSTGFFNNTGNKFKNISTTIEEIRRFTLPVEVTDEYQKYLTSRNKEKLPIDDSDDFVTPPPKHIKEHVPPKKAPKNAPGVQPVDYGRELQKLKVDVKQLHKQLNSFMDYVSEKFKELFELINSKLGSSKVKYGAYPEEDTSGRQDNNDFVSNIKFGGNEDVEMDGCQIGGSEGKDVPHSQRDTNVAGQLGVNAMEGPPGVKVDMFVAKVTFTPDVVYAGVIGEIADAAVGETEEESEKQKVTESRTGGVCAIASVDAASGETEEESEKQKVLESQTGVVCATASVDELVGEMVLTGVVAAKGKKQSYAIKHPFQSKIGTGINSSLLNVFAAWVKEGKSRKKNEIYPKHISELNPAYDLGIFHVEDKKWFYTLAYNGQPLDDSHIDVLFYYLRKKGKYDKDLPVIFTTTDWYFDEKINELWQAFIDTDEDNDVCTPKHVIAEYIQGNCGVFAASFAEYFIEGKTPPKKFNAYVYRRKFDVLLWDYATKKMELNARSDDEIIGRQNKSRKQKK
ncbi:uncharacterized protein [Nicotiana sylvestris]|uniref:uncharacterized protein n=1 Tax=Nicotiana sylvestris TaxID=4096 RepID=UPI00388C57FC